MKAVIMKSSCRSGIVYVEVVDSGVTYTLEWTYRSKKVAHKREKKSDLVTETEVQQSAGSETSETEIEGGSDDDTDNIQD